MSRPQGSRNNLVRLNYDTIAKMAVGITGDTAKKYANRGQYNSRDLGSILRWVNQRRQQQGLPLVGLPNEVVSAAVSATAADTPVEAPEDTRGRVLTGGLFYDPRLGEYRGLDDKGNR